MDLIRRLKRNMLTLKKLMNNVHIFRSKDEFLDYSRKRKDEMQNLSDKAKQLIDFPSVEETAKGLDVSVDCIEANILIGIFDTVFVDGTRKVDKGSLLKSLQDQTFTKIEVRSTNEEGHESKKTGRASWAK